MAKWQGWTATAPAWVYSIYFAVFGGLSTAVAFWLQGTDASGLRVITIGLVAATISCALGTTAVIVMRRRDGAAAGFEHDLSAPYRAVRLGEPPEDRTLDQPTLALLQRRRGQLKSLSKLNRRLALVWVPMSILFAVTTQSPIWMVLAAFAVFSPFISRVSTRRQNARLDRLEARLDTRSEQTPIP